ncbi:MAG: hypothetical protein P8166_02420 [Candidatus Thiodiazotropha sp.]
MTRKKRTTGMGRKLAFVAMVTAMAAMGDLYAFADEAPKTEPAPQSSSAPKPVKQPRRVTIEQVYTGMREAEQLRAAIARADPAVDNAMVAEKWGVQVISVSYAADGFWLGFRFRVLDPEKANDLFDTKIKPYLESEANGVKLGVPTAAKIGALRTTNRGHNIKAGKIYNIMFSNPGFQIQPGQKVTVVAGDFKVEHLTVRGSREYLSINQSAQKKVK